MGLTPASRRARRLLALAIIAAGLALLAWLAFAWRPCPGCAAPLF